mgnify:CR=1 FL=1|jgi:hypothetical protein
MTAAGVHQLRAGKYLTHRIYHERLAVNWPLTEQWYVLQTV